MDKSEIYIKMADCPEIQDREFGEEGDIVVVRKHLSDYNGWQEYRKGSIEVVGNDGEYDISNPNKDNFIWLPRQDQLQEMVGGWTLELLDRFHHFCMWDDQFEETREKMTPISMEQLWLAFVMEEKFNKVWNGEKWDV